MTPCRCHFIEIASDKCNRTVNNNKSVPVLKFKMYNNKQLNIQQKLSISNRSILPEYHSNQKSKFNKIKKFTSARKNIISILCCGRHSHYIKFYSTCSKDT